MNLKTEAWISLSIGIGRAEFRRYEATLCTIHLKPTLCFTSDVIAEVTLVTRDWFVYVRRTFKASRTVYLNSFDSGKRVVILLGI